MPTWDILRVFVIVPMASALGRYCTDGRHGLQERLLEVLIAAVGMRRDNPPNRVLVGFCLIYLTINLL